MATSGTVQVSGRRAPAGPQGRRRLARWLSVGAVAVITVSGCSTEVNGVAADTGPARSAGYLTPPSLPSQSPTSMTTDLATTDPTTTDPTTTDPSTTDPSTTDATRTDPTTKSSTRAPDPTRSSSPSTSRAGGGEASAELLTTLGDGGAIEVGAPSAKIVIDIYEEPLCPPCADFSARYGASIAEAVLSGKALVRFRLTNFLDGRSHSKNYSTRVIAALLAVVAYDRDPATVLAVQEALLDPRIQPVENGAKDLTDAELAAIAAKAGAGAATVTAIRQGIARNTATAIADATAATMKTNSVSGTPFVQVNGRTADYRNTDWLTKALNG